MIAVIVALMPSSSCATASVPGEPALFELEVTRSSVTRVIRLFTSLRLEEACAARDWAYLRLLCQEAASDCCRPIAEIWSQSCGLSDGNSSFLPEEICD